MPDPGAALTVADIDLTEAPSAAPRIYLSPPMVGEAEIEQVTAALRSGWVAPVGPDLAEFESQVTQLAGVTHGVALASGTAAIHLGLKALGVGAGDEVVVPTLTFGATAFAVVHAGGVPVFLDCEATTWNLDPELLDAFLSERAVTGRLPKAIVTVDLFGRMCDYDAILAVADRYGVPVLEDAAEALGSTYKGRAAGSFGRVGVFSFNGNKIITTSGGGMLVTDDEAIADKVRYWSTQAREDVVWYEHNDIGFNFRMSNILAALGCAQLQRLPGIIERLRQINARYQELLSDVAEVLGDDPWGRTNMWLTTIRLRGGDQAERSLRRQAVQDSLASMDIEARPVWKPMHRQPVFLDHEALVNGTSDRIFADGLCLPSGAAMTDADVTRVATAVREAI